MRLRVSYFALPKAGNSSDEYEDAYYPVYPDTEDVVRDRFRFGVADGASEGYLSRHWAQCLARSFHRSSGLLFEEIFLSALDRWDRWLPRYLEARARGGRPVQWFEAAKLAQGAFATLLGIQLRSRRGNEHAGRWVAVALGDTCLFQVRGDSLIASFPLARAEQFDITPNLVPSKPVRQEVVPSFARRVVGTWQHGDSFFLMTDALAAWFLREVECGEAPWRILGDLDTDEVPPFADWVEDLREHRLMRNDDVTLVRVDVD